MGEAYRSLGTDVEQAEQARRAALFRFIAWFSLALAIFALLAFVLLGLLNPVFPLQVLGPTVGAFIACDLAALWSSYRGAQGRADMIFLAGFTMAILVVIHFANGATGPFAPALVAVPVLAGLMGGGRTTRWVAAIVLLLYLALFGLEQTGLWPAADSLGPTLPWVSAGMVVLLVAAMAVIVSVFAQQTQRALVVAQERGQELLQASEEARASAQREREAREREGRGARQLRVVVGEYVSFLESIAGGDYEAQLPEPDIGPESLGTRDLRTLGGYLETTVETLVEALTRMQTVQRRYVAESWSDASRLGAVGQGFQYREKGIGPVEGDWSPVLERAIRQRSAVVERGELALPILLSGEAIGVVGARRGVSASDVQAGWSDGELSIIQAATDQLSQTIETLRLLDETQRTAARERMAGEITANLARSLDVEAVLQTVVSELGEKLSADEVSVWVGPQDASTPKQPGEENR